MYTVRYRLLTHSFCNILYVSSYTSQVSHGTNSRHISGQSDNVYQERGSGVCSTKGCPLSRQGGGRGWALFWSLQRSPGQIPGRTL